MKFDGSVSELLAIEALGRHREAAAATLNRELAWLKRNAASNLASAATQAQRSGDPAPLRKALTDVRTHLEAIEAAWDALARLRVVPTLLPTAEPST